MTFKKDGIREIELQGKDKKIQKLAFKIYKNIQNQLLITVTPDGYLKKLW